MSGFAPVKASPHLIARPPPVALPSKRPLNDESGTFCPSPRRSRDSAEGPISPTTSAWCEQRPSGGDLDPSSYERPSGSALLTTFQRLGVSSGHETKRLRVSAGPREWSGPQEEGAVEMEVPLHTGYSLVVRASPPPCLGSPAAEELHDSGASGGPVEEPVSALYRRSPTDLERLSPVSQLLLSSRPAQLHRLLAAGRANAAIDPHAATDPHLASAHHQPATAHEHAAAASPSAGMAGGCGVGGGVGGPMIRVGPLPSRTLSAPAYLCALEREAEGMGREAAMREAAAEAMAEADGMAATAAAEEAMAAEVAAFDAAEAAMAMRVEAAAAVVGSASQAHKSSTPPPRPPPVMIPVQPALLDAGAWPLTGTHTPKPSRRLLRRFDVQARAFPRLPSPSLAFSHLLTPSHTFSRLRASTCRAWMMRRREERAAH